MQHAQFDPEFYPCPRPIAYKMLNALQNKEARYFLEPSAGKGDLAEAIRPAGDASDWRVKECRREVECIEASPDLCSILQKKGYPVVGYDWLDFEGVCFYDCVIMNPPFSNGDEHLLKAWDFLHDGEIVCLLNQETLDNPHTERRRRLLEIIQAHGRVESLGDVFKTAERSTPVNVAMVYLKKTAPDDRIELWANESAEREPDEPDADPQYLAVRDVLGNMQHYYDKANEHMLKAFHHVRMAAEYMRANSVGAATRYTEERGMDTKEILGLAMSNVNSARAEWTRMHRRRAWHQVINKSEFHQFLDHKQAEELVRDIDRNANIPFTKENIKGTLKNIFLQRGQLFEKSVANMFDQLTQFFAGNTAQAAAGGGGDYSGWKTNSDYMVNPKLVFPWGCSNDGSNFSPWSLWRCSGRADIYNDLDRIMCALDGGRKLSQCISIGKALERAFAILNHPRDAKAEWDFGDGVNEYDLAFKFQARSSYFDIRFYKKGTVHLTFRRQDLWEKFNVKAAAGKKWVGRGKAA